MKTFFKKRFIFTGFSFDNKRRLRRSLKVVLFSLFLYWERVLLQSFIHTIWYLFHVLSNKGLHGPRSSLYWSFIYKKEFLKSIIRNTMLIMMYLIMCNNKKLLHFEKEDGRSGHKMLFSRYLRNDIKNFRTTS